MRSSRSVELCLDLAQPLLAGLDARAELSRSRLELVRAGAAGFHGRAHLGGDLLALGTQAVDVAQQPAALLVRGQGLVDELRILALGDGAVADRVGVVAQALQADAHC